MMFFISIFLQILKSILGFGGHAFVEALVNGATGTLYLIYYYKMLNQWIGYISGADEDIFSKGVEV